MGQLAQQIGVEAGRKFWGQEEAINEMMEVARAELQQQNQMLQQIKDGEGTS